MNFMLILLFAYSLYLTYNLINKYNDDPQYLEKNKCQSKNKLTKEQVESKLPTFLRNLVFVLTTNTIALLFFHDWYLLNNCDYGLITQFFVQVLPVVFLEDFFNYCSHRLLHSYHWLYIKIHKEHHKAYAPCPMDVLYFSLSDAIIVFCNTFMSIKLVGNITFESLVIIIFLRQLHEIHLHSGMKSSKWLKYIPFYGTNDKHDIHHSISGGNYASTFTIWDHIFNTSIDHNDYIIVE